MKPLPERRKTPEEIAALRDSLGIPDAMPGQAPPPRPDAEDGPVAEDLKASVFESPPADDQPKPGAKPVRSLRKSERLVVDQPKQHAVADDGRIPLRRHTENEIKTLRKIEPPPQVQPAEHLASLTLSRWWLALFYGLGGFLLLLVHLGNKARHAPKFDLPADWVAGLVEWPPFTGLLFGMLLFSSALMLVGALWIRLRRPRSQHHAGILTIVAVLVLVFGTLYFYSELHGA